MLMGQVGTCAIKDVRSRHGYEEEAKHGVTVFSLFALGDFKLKPVCIHQSENPRTLNSPEKACQPVI